MERRQCTEQLQTPTITALPVFQEMSLFCSSIYIKYSPTPSMAMRSSWLTSWDRGRISQTSMMYCSTTKSPKMLEIYQQDLPIIIICGFHHVSVLQLALRTYLIFLTNRCAGVNPTARNGDENSSAEKTTRYRRQNSKLIGSKTSSEPFFVSSTI